MKSILFATITANGFIADNNGEEDFFDEKNWEMFKNLVIENGNVIWGRKTYEMVVNWGGNYINDFSTVKIIVISKIKKDYMKSNVTVCENLDTAVKSLKRQKLNPFIAGGSFTYSSALKQGLVDKLILNFNSIFIPNGIALFDDKIDCKAFKINSIEKISDTIAQISLEK